MSTNTAPPACSDEAVRLAAVMLGFLAGEEQIAAPAVAIEVAALRSSVEGLLARQPEELIATKRVAFGSDESVTYPSTEAELLERIGNETTILQGLESGGGDIEGLCHLLETRTSRLMTASAYLSNRSSAAFGWHVDRWDSLIVQLAGTKSFLFRDQTVSLREGDVLCFREGVEHRTTTDGASVHLSVGVHPQRISVRA